MTRTAGHAQVPVGQLHEVFANDPIQDMSPDRWHAVVDTNLTGVFNAIRAVLPTMIKRNSGRIIATSSLAAHGGAANLSNYVAAKWGIVGLIKSVALDLERYGITANAILPSTANTPMVRNAAMRSLFCPDIENPTDEDFESRVLAVGMPMLLEPIEITNQIFRSYKSTTPRPKPGAGKPSTWSVESPIRHPSSPDASLRMGIPDPRT